MSLNYFRGTPVSPYHISVGAVVLNDEGKVCCHYFKNTGGLRYNDAQEVYILMRETLEPLESIETCLARGLKEEFGIIAKLNSYLGSIVSSYPYDDDPNSIIQKTTLYFLCDFISIDATMRTKADPETCSEIKWLAPQELILKSKEQSRRLGRSDIDESQVVVRAISR